MEASEQSVLVAVHAYGEGDQPVKLVGVAAISGFGVQPSFALGCPSGMHEASRTTEPPLAAGENDDFGDFYRREYDRAVRLAWLLTGSKAAAEDVVQDAMTAVYRTFSRVTTPGAYLRRSVIHTAGNWQRNEHRQAERSIMLAERWEPALAPADAQPFDLVARLPYRERVVIVGRYWGGWSEAEIAGALRCRPGTVKSLASRALNRLRNEVQP